MTETRKVSDLLDDRQCVLGERQRYAIDDAPDHGEAAFAPREVLYTDESDVYLVQIRYTVWGDYVGSTVERANYLGILADYPDHVVRLEWGYNGHGLALRLDREIPEDFYDALLGLSDYPLWDDQALYELESRLEQEDWEEWARSEVIRDAERKLSDIADVDPLVGATDVDPDAVDELAGEWFSNGELTWEGETAVGGYFTDLELLADEIVKREVARQHESWGDYSLSYLHCEGQTSLAI